MSQVCNITGKKRNNGRAISHSHVRTKKIQKVNLQSRKIWSVRRQSWVRCKISTKAMKSLMKIA
uniref:Large ribosomal subunit protein bL28c n=1 Tax=Yamadaella caenomyce TaxID=259029 RepID=A0A1G4NYQ7_9FLOR|nr:Ribosomal protein L28 [Yamadaella caenomyce]SCW23775.1 Ribosomal protein L28 [Yamadaella caenomyce]